MKLRDGGQWRQRNYFEIFAGLSGTAENIIWGRHL